MSWVAYDSSELSTGGSDPGIINIYYKRAVVKFNYSKDILTSIFGASSAQITKIRFYVTGTVDQTLPSYQIAMKNSGSSSTALSTNPDTSGWTVVRAAANLSVTSLGYMEFTINPPFTWTGGTLSFSFAFGAVGSWVDRAYKRLHKLS